MSTSRGAKDGVDKAPAPSLPWIGSPQEQRWRLVRRDAYPANDGWRHSHDRHDPSIVRNDAGHQPRVRLHDNSTVHLYLEQSEQQGRADAPSRLAERRDFRTT